MFKIVKSLALVSVAVAAVIGGTYAYFSDTATSNTNSFTTGTLSINNGKVAETPAIVLNNIAPGWISELITITIENNGNIDLGWLGDWQFDGNTTLKNALYVDYAKMQFLAQDGTTSWLDDPNPTLAALYEADGGDLFIKDGTGHGPYGSFFTNIANANDPFNVVTLDKFDNNNGMLPIYEHMGALKPGYKYRLIVKFGFTPEADNTYQNLGPVTAKLVVKATQINAEALKEQDVAAASAPGTVTWMNTQIADQTE